MDAGFNSARSVYAADVDGDGDMEVLGAASYTLQYADNSSFTNATTVTGITASQYDLSPVPADGT